ncbi:MAG: class I SAM-dependent methyltransferase [Nitrospirota bacterium]
MQRKLLIGGTQKAPGWEVLNIIAGPNIDHVCDAHNLSQFPDNTFTALYASHVLEHFDYVKELAETLTEWKRILIPGGILYVSVPDMDILAQLFLRKDKLALDERFRVMRMMFGGHVDKYDYHVIGLNQEFLMAFLRETGFVNMRRVNSFGLFHDTSIMLFKGVPISLNVIAEKP